MTLDHQPPSEPQKSILLRGLVLVILIVMSMILHPSGAGAEPFDISDVDSFSDQCFRLELLERGPVQIDYRPVPASLAWTTSGVWFDERTILLVDMAFSRVAKVPLEEGLISSLTELGGQELDSPTYISSLPDDTFFVLDTRVAGDKQSKLVYRVDRSGGILSSISVSRGRRLGEITLNGIHRFSAMGDGVLAYVGLRGVEGDAWNAFVYLDQDSYEIFQRVDEEYVHLMTRDSAAMTSIGQIGYLLLFKENPRLARVETGGVVTVLDHFPEMNLAGGFRTPRLERSQQFVEGMIQSERKMQASRTVKSIFSWQERLFILAKSQMGRNGETTWWAVEVSQEDGSEIARFELPTTAEDIVLIPGLRFAIVEKGPVKRAGEPPGYAIYRRSSSIVLFSSEWLGAGDGMELVAVKSAVCENVSR